MHCFLKKTVPGSRITNFRKLVPFQLKPISFRKYKAFQFNEDSSIHILQIENSMKPQSTYRDHSAFDMYITQMNFFVYFYIHLFVHYLPQPDKPCKYNIFKIFLTTSHKLNIFHNYLSLNIIGKVP